MADLLGAVRLPSGAHQRAAGTQVVTDLLVRRRRESDVEPASHAWEQTRPIDGEVRVNAYFDAHPEHVLGTLRVGTGQYGAPALLVDARGQDTAAALAGALVDITARARRDGQTMTARGSEIAPQSAALQPVIGLWDGHLAVHPDGGFTRVLAGEHVALDVPAGQRAELRALLGLRDGARGLLAAEAVSVEDTATIDELRADLRSRYETYTSRYGAINRFSLRATGRQDPETGQPSLARIAPRVMQTLRSDPFAPLVAALESFDDTTRTAVPATLLSQRTLAPRTPVLGVEHADDALAVCREARGRVELEQIAALLGTEPEEARAALGELVYDDPATGRLVSAAEYLSGNVRDKLDVARAAAGERPELAANVAALGAVVQVLLAKHHLVGRPQWRTGLAPGLSPSAAVCAEVLDTRRTFGVPARVAS